jgi:SAM-dependent methyltransferase
MSAPEHFAATRDVYNHTADRYVAAIGTTISANIEAPIDRAALAAFAEIVRTDPGTIADVGCGPGRVAAFLSNHGLDAVGVDASNSMLELGRHAHPHIQFESGALHSLPYAAATLRGAVYWYSIIHTPPAELAGVFTELSRVLRPEGDVLFAFQAGEGTAVTKPDAYESGVTLTSYHHNVHDVAQQMLTAGLEVTTTIVRTPVHSHESTPQAFVFARSGRQL